MMLKNLFAYTSPAAMPEYVSINQRDGKITLDARGPAKDGQFGETVFCIVSQRVMRHVMLKDYDDAIAEGTRRTTWERDR
jgi:hypothetical protein